MEMKNKTLGAQKDVKTLILCTYKNNNIGENVFNVWYLCGVILLYNEQLEMDKGRSCA